jgi:hypothetical protein
MGEGENLANAGWSSAMWVYRDTGGDVLATMVADDYIDDGNDQGLRVGDIIAFVETAVDAQWMIVDTIDAAGLVAVTSFSNP